MKWLFGLVLLIVVASGCDMSVNDYNNFQKTFPKGEIYPTFIGDVTVIVKDVNGIVYRCRKSDPNTCKKLVDIMKKEK